MKYTDSELKILLIKDDSCEIMFAKSALLISKWFKDKCDKAGKPYLNHLYHVASKVDEPIEKIAALLHDLVEDTTVTFEDLEEFGFTSEVIDILRLLTKPGSRSYDEYIDNIINSKNIHALHIKIKDMEHNLDMTRLKDEKEIERLAKKYEHNYEKLKEALNQEGDK